MPKRTQKERREERPDVEAEASAAGKAMRSKSIARRAEDGHVKAEGERHGIPRWRQIEIMRERAQLREALGGLDLYDDLDDYESEVFGSEEDNEVLYDHSDDPEEVVVEIDDDDFDDENFEDFEED
jgi:hypothetical protein